MEEYRTRSKTRGKTKKKSSPAKIIIISVVTTLLIVFAVFALIPPFMIGGMVNEHISFSQVWTAEEFGLVSEELTLTTEDGLQLAAYEVFWEDPKAVVIFLSGIHEPSVTAFYGHAGMLLEQGYSSILLEMRAHGESEGDLIALGYHEHLDTKAAVEYINSQEKYTDVPIVVYGLSMGGATAINSISQIPEIDALISLSAYSSWADVFYDNMVNLRFPRFFAAIQKPFVNFYLNYKYGKEYSQITPKNTIQDLGARPALLIHSTEDSQVPYDSFERLMENAPPHVQTFIRQGDHHLIVLPGYFLNPPGDAEYAEQVINFLEEHFGREPEEQEEEALEEPAGE